MVPKIGPNSGPQNWSHFGPLVPFWPQRFEFWGRLDPPTMQLWISKVDFFQSSGVEMFGNTQALLRRDVFLISGSYCWK